MSSLVQMLDPLGLTSLADRGFVLQSEFAAVRAELLKPRKSCRGLQLSFTMDDVNMGGRIARARVHVERAFCLKKCGRCCEELSRSPIVTWQGVYSFIVVCCVTTVGNSSAKRAEQCLACLARLGNQVWIALRVTAACSLFHARTSTLRHL